jgi:hypothetical protein
VTLKADGKTVPQDGHFSGRCGKAREREQRDSNT